MRIAIYPPRETLRNGKPVKASGKPLHSGRLLFSEETEDGVNKVNISATNIIFMPRFADDAATFPRYAQFESKNKMNEML